MMKICSKCGKAKDHSDFYRDGRAKGGLWASCKECAALTNKKYRDSARGKAVRKRYRESSAGKAKIREYQNSAERKAKQKSYRDSGAGEAARQRRLACYQASFDPDAEGIKTCSRCGGEKPLSAFYRNAAARDGLQPCCKLCASAWHKGYLRTEKGKMSKQEYRESGRVKEASRKYRKSAKGAARRHAYNVSPKVKQTARERQNLPAIKAKKRVYNSSPYGKALRRARNHRRKALKLNATIGHVDEKAIYKLCGNRCAYCGSTKNLSLDHIVALSKGGAHCESNLLVACRSCNSSKGTKPVAEWLGTRPMTMMPVDSMRTHTP